MTISDMLSQSGLLTLLGMGVVFSFIIILIVFMQLLHFVLRSLKLDKEENTVPVSEQSSAVPLKTDFNAEEIVAVLAAAVREKGL